MRKVSTYMIGKETFDDMLNAGRFNPCLEITFRGQSGNHIHKISAGYTIIHLVILILPMRINQ